MTVFCLRDLDVDAMLGRPGFGEVNVELVASSGDVPSIHGPDH